MSAISKYNILYEFFIAIAIVFGTLLCIFPSEGTFFHWWEAHTLIFMFSTLVLGLLFFMFNYKKLMIVSFGACAALCLFLNDRTQAPLKNADQTSDYLVTIAQFSLAGIDQSVLDVELAAMLDTKADVISIQEISPAQLKHVNEIFICCGYPYYECIFDSVRTNSLAVYSKYSFEFIRQIPLPKAPSIAGKVKLPYLNDQQYEFYFFNSALYPTDSQVGFDQSKENLQLFAQELNRLKAPIFVFGDYEMVTWSKDLQAFRQASNLNDSRRGIEPTSPHGYFSIFDQPFDHIFYSNHFECINFETISSVSTPHLGIVGTYQFEIQEQRNDVKQTSQEF